MILIAHRCIGMRFMVNPATCRGLDGVIVIAVIVITHVIHMM
jgi:hypothetical protein